MQRHEASSRLGLPIRLLTVALILTAAALAWLGANVYHAYPLTQMTRKVSAVWAVSSLVLSLFAWLAVLQSLRRWRKTLAREIAEREQVEEALRESKERLTRIVETTTDGITIVDGEGKITLANAAAEGILGLTHSGIRQRTCNDPAWKITTADGKPFAEADLPFVRVVRTGEPVSGVEHAIKHPDGRRVILSVNAAPLRDATGAVVGVVASLRDITERKRAQEARRRSEERFRLLVESVEDYAIFLLDTDGRVVSWNAGAERIKGYLADEIIGHHFSAFYPEEDRRRNKPERALRVAAAEGRFEDEGWRVRKDGSRFWADALITAVRDEAGRLRGFAKVTRDLTERKRAEHVLRGQKTALTRTIHALTAEPELDAFLGQVLTAVAEQFDSCSTSLWFCDAAQDTVSLHMTCGARIPSGEQPCPTAGSGPLPARDVPLWQELMRTRQPLVIEDVARDPRITRCPGLAPPDAQTLLLVPLLLGDEAIGWLSIANARNRGFQPEEIELAQALAQQATLAVQLTGLAEQGQQAAVLAERNRMAREIHDTLAQGFTGILIQLEAAEDTLTEEPEAAQAHIARARDLARQSLAEARRSVWALRSQALEGSSLPGTLANLTRQMIFGTHMHMEFHVHGTPRSLPADTESNLLRIGLEALTNALKHAEATAIRVELSFASGQVRLSVQDNGKGFDPHRPTRADSFGLTGMRERAQSMGGQLTVASRPGQGTEVVVVAPTAASDMTGGLL